jgi:hypothetical protein
MVRHGSRVLGFFWARSVWLHSHAEAANGAFTKDEARPIAVNPAATVPGVAGLPTTAAFPPASGTALELKQAAARMPPLF